MTNPTIPFGYKRVTGQLQKGDGIWNGTRFAKAKKAYPNTEYVEIFAIRKCVVEQPVLPGTEEASAAVTPQDVANLFAADAKRMCEQANAAMDAGVSDLLEGMAEPVPEMEIE